MNEVNSLTGQRPPIVAVLGHVDHGKTTLLDAIRQTNVAKKEAGGITQSIGASVVTTKEGNRITFIDTPGHAAFKNMRSRGAKAADIAILVVAAEEGVKPQTKEALEYILDAGIPYIVAATKIDLSSASLELVQTDLEKLGVLFEGSGGDVPLIPVSARKGTGINELLETISLVAEVNAITGDANAPLEAVVIETSKDNRGPLASIIVSNGTLRVGDEIVTQTVKTKVRGIFNYQGLPVKEILPGEPAQILGFAELPPVGSKVWTGNRSGQQLEKSSDKPLQHKITGDEIPAVIKAQNMGALEALLANLPPKVVVMSSGVGDVTQSDIFVAKSSNSAIFAFESETPATVKRLAETEGIRIYSFKIIYELFEKLEEIIKSGQIEILGKAQIVAEFPYENQRVAGCKVLQGTIKRTDSLQILRGEKVIQEAKAISIKKYKQEVTQVSQGEECGIVFSPNHLFKIDDTVLSIKR